MTIQRRRRISDGDHRRPMRPSDDRSTLPTHTTAGGGTIPQETDLSTAPAGTLGTSTASRNGPYDGLLGRQIGQYKLGTLLGSGGMGEVYRAYDEKLGRDVAIKVLQKVRLPDPQQRARFDQEARVLAALNHPHIAAIYGVDDSVGIRALILELVEGPTIADRLAKGPLPVREALVIARQIAEALEAAHEKGIVHRDLKPANIKVSPDGVVKVLDFGLAKTVQRNVGSPLPACETREGVILGTATYMSPEQSRGLPVDKRTDVWAFGCVLYEMLTGERAFRGDALLDVFTAVLDREPDWGLLPDRTPANVRHLVQRCLQKDPHERLRDIGEARIELQGATKALTTGGSGSLARWAKPRQSPWLRGSTAAVIAALCVMAASLAYWASRSRDGATLVGRPRQLTVAAGWQADPALSPDGNSIAYSSNESGHADIWVIDAQGGNPLRLTAGEGDHRQPAWFPDGSAVAFVLKRREHDTVWKVPRLGGTATLLVAEASDPAISPDGSLIAFTRSGPSGFERIAIAPIDDATSARYITGDSDGLWNHRQPAWSPDGRRICYVAQNALWVVAVNGGRPWRLTTDNESDREPVWSADGGYVYFSSFREGTEALWRVSASGGRPDRVTMGTGPERQPSVSRDGTRLAYSTMSSSSDVALLDLHTGKRLELTGERDEYQPTLAPDGSAVAFASDRWGGRLDLWIQPLANYAPEGQAVRLTDHPGAANYPSFSPDGRWVAYGRVEGERRDIWIISARGGPPVRITEGGGAKFHPSWSPDGSRLVFAAQQDGLYQIRIVPVSDGRRAGMATNMFSGPGLCMSPVWSPDGSQIAYVSSGKIWLAAVSGARKPQRLTSTTGAERVRWNPGSGRLFASGFWDGEHVTILEIDPATGSTAPLPFPVVLGQNEEYLHFDVSTDGRLLAFDWERVRGAVWVVDNKPR